MTPQVISLSALGSTAWIPVDYKQNPFNIGIACVVSDTPNLTYRVEYTLDDIFNPAIIPTAFIHNTITGKTSNFSATQTQPVRAIRLTTTAYTSGTVTMTALQGVVNPIIYTPNPITLHQSGIPFALFAGDGGATGFSFTGTRGVFTLSAAPIQYISAFTRSCYAYMPAGAGGLAAGLYWCQMSDDTNGEIFADTYTVGSGEPSYVESPTALPNCSAGRITQTTAEVTVGSFILPGGSMGPNGIWTADFAMRGSTGGSNKAIRIKIGSQRTFFSGGSSPIGDFSGWFQNQGIENRQTGVSHAIGRSHSTTNSLSSLDVSETLIDTRVDQTVNVTLQTNANTESVFGMLRKFSVQYGA